MIIENIMLVITFLIAWIMLWITHELMHLIEAYRQGATDGYIKLEFWHGWIPHMTETWKGLVTNKKMVHLAGGLYTAIISLTIGLYAVYTPTIQDMNIELPFVTIGVLQLIYSVYERQFINKWSKTQYMRVHYYLYAVVLISMFIFYGVFRL